MSEKMIAIYILFFTVGLVCAEFDYCKKFGPTHTMCKYPENSGCDKISTGINKAIKKDILKAHNEVRQKIANGKQPGHPTAANMKEMIWDDELATVAQRWADQCTFDHDKKRATERFPDSAGQNLAYVGWPIKIHSETNFSGEAVRMWYNEVSMFDPKNIQNFKFDTKVGHYTQVVWADTYAIGCGFAYYKQGRMYKKYYVCNYGPSGNVLGGKMYKFGKPCSACKVCSKEYPGLCKTKGNEQ